MTQLILLIVCINITVGVLAGGLAARIGGSWAWAIAIISAWACAFVLLWLVVATYLIDPHPMAPHDMWTSLMLSLKIAPGLITVLAIPAVLISSIFRWVIVALAALMTDDDQPSS